MEKFHANHKIGDIMAKFPAVEEIFNEYKIDFCCGGGRPLIEAIEEQGLDEAEVLQKINNLYEQYKDKLNDGEKNWLEAPLAELVDYIINKHHAYLYENLPKISELTTTILRVHGGSHPELSKVHRLFHTVKMELEEHLIKEETIQYPAIREYLNTRAKEDLDKAVNIIKELEEEHSGAGDILKELRNVTNDYEIPCDACDTFRLTYEKLEELETDLFRHIHLENNILFPRLFELQKQMSM